jgi:hypothetical protein
MLEIDSLEREIATTTASKTGGGRRRRRRRGNVGGNQISELALRHGIEIDLGHGVLFDTSEVEKRRKGQQQALFV